MKEKRENVHRHMITLMTLILNLLLIASSVTPAAASGAAPLARELTRVSPSDMEATTPAGLTDYLRRRTDDARDVRHVADGDQTGPGAHRPCELPG